MRKFAFWDSHSILSKHSSLLLAFSGADPENVEPGGANSKNYQTEPGGAYLCFGLTYKGEHGGRAPGAPPLNPRLTMN